MDDAIVIVSGLPRSGTSMMMGMLHAGGLSPLMDGERPADADNPRGYYEYGPVRRLREDASWLAGARGKAVKIVSPLLNALPGEIACSVIFMERDLDEVLASQRALLHRRAAQGVIRPAEFDASRLDREDARLRVLYAEHLHRVRDWLRRRAHTPVLGVAYTGVLGDPHGAALTVAAFLGLPLDVAAMARAVDPSLRRQFGLGAGNQPKISPSNNSPQ